MKYRYVYIIKMKYIDLDLYKALIYTSPINFNNQYRTHIFGTNAWNSVYKDLEKYIILLIKFYKVDSSPVQSLLTCLYKMAYKHISFS